MSLLIGRYEYTLEGWIDALESEGGTGQFDDSHLQLVAALGAIAGPALANARRLELVESENRRLQAEIGRVMHMKRTPEPVII